MPLFNLLWSRPNAPIDGVPQDDSTATCQVRASTWEKAAAIAAERVFVPEEILGCTLSWEELDEDGDVVRTSADAKPPKTKD